MSGIDRGELDALLAELLADEPGWSRVVIRDRILALVRPVEGVTLTPEEVSWLLTYVRNSEQVARDFGPGSAGGRDASWFAGLAARLQASS